jgi:hypothetical protein
MSLDIDPGRAPFEAITDTSIREQAGRLSNGAAVQPPQAPKLSVEMPLDVLHLHRPPL